MKSKGEIRKEAYHKACNDLEKVNRARKIYDKAKDKYDRANTTCSESWESYCIVNEDWQERARNEK